MNELTISVAALAWGIGTAVISFVGFGLIWLIRLEGKVKTNAALLIAVVEDLHYIRDRLDRFTEGDLPDRES